MPHGPHHQHDHHRPARRIPLALFNAGQLHGWPFFFFFLSDSLPTILSISVSFFSKGNNKRHPNKHKQQEKRKIIKQSRTYRRIDRTRSDDSSDLPQVIDVVESRRGGGTKREWDNKRGNFVPIPFFFFFLDFSSLKANSACRFIF